MTFSIAIRKYDIQHNNKFHNNTQHNTKKGNTQHNIKNVTLISDCTIAAS
jgi:hypothetical protein